MLYVEQCAMTLTLSSQHKKRYYTLHVERCAMTMTLSLKHNKRCDMLHVIGYRWVWQSFCRT